MRSACVAQLSREPSGGSRDQALMMDLEETTFQIEAVGRGRGTWTLKFTPELLEFYPPSGDEPIGVPREEIGGKVFPRKGLGGGPYLYARLPKTTGFRVSQEILETLSRWRGPLTSADLRVALKRRLAWAIPIAILWIFTSLPFQGDPSIGVQPIPFDRIGMFLGLSLFGLAALRRVWRSPKILLLDTIWFVLLGLDLCADAYRGEGAYLTLFIPLVLWGAWGSFRDYERFSDDFEPTASA